MLIAERLRTYRQQLLSLILLVGGNNPGPFELLVLHFQEPWHYAPHLIILRQRLVFETLRRNPGASSGEIHDLAGIWYVSRKTTTRDLNAWIKKDLVRKTVKGRGTRYFLA
jgi:DNA-binding MarR family transcriptional regulator